MNDDDKPLYGKSFFDIRRVAELEAEQWPDEREPKVPPTGGQVLAGFCLACIGAAGVVVLLVLALLQ